MKKIILLLIILLTCTSCKDYVEINDFAIISGIILDYTNEYEMISELIINEEETKILKELLEKLSIGLEKENNNGR